MAWRYPMQSARRQFRPGEGAVDYDPQLPGGSGIFAAARQL